MPVNIAVLTVSDSRTLESDTSGQCLMERLQAAGHRLAERQLVTDCKYSLRALFDRRTQPCNMVELLPRLTEK